MNQIKRIDYLIEYLLREQLHIDKRVEKYPADTMEEKQTKFRGLCNVRPAEPITAKFIEIQDAYLTEWNNGRALTSLDDLEEVQRQLYVWQGDITSLAVDVIVNAANSDFIGCRIANHNCIDNIIHTRAGVQLRLACHELIQEQGRKEAVGKAKITKAYNLPAKHVIHTVGPYIDNRGVTPMKEQLLASSYRACLALADDYEQKTIAFCCISTGEFNFPSERAAEIAIQTVKAYLKETESKLNVIFNVFKEDDLHIYQRRLSCDNLQQNGKH